MSDVTNTRTRDQVLADAFGRIGAGESVAEVFAGGDAADKLSPDLPTVRTFWRWVATDDAVRAAYLAALKARALVHAERLADVTKELRLLPRDELSAERIALGRLESDNVKWTAARMLPKVYGDRTILSGDPDNPIPPLVIIGANGTPDGKG